MTTDEARKHRIACEQAIELALHELTRATGLDIARVEVFLVVSADERGDPRRTARAVRVELCV